LGGSEVYILRRMKGENLEISTYEILFAHIPVNLELLFYILFQLNMVFGVSNHNTPSIQVRKYK
jgi:hypothetical protein